MSSTPPSFGALLDAFKDARLIASGLRRKAVISPEDRHRWDAALLVLERCIRIERASRKGRMSAGDAERWANQRTELSAAFVEASKLTLPLVKPEKLSPLQRRKWDNVLRMRQALGEGSGGVGDSIRNLGALLGGGGKLLEGISWLSVVSNSVLGLSPRDMLAGAIYTRMTKEHPADPRSDTETARQAFEKADTFVTEMRRQSLAKTGPVSVLEALTSGRRTGT
jgi:hypothetical protein